MTHTLVRFGDGAREGECALITTQVLVIDEPEKPGARAQMEDYAA